MCESAMKSSEMASSLNFFWQNRRDNFQIDPQTTEIWPKELNVP